MQPYRREGGHNAQQAKNEMPDNGPPPVNGPGKNIFAGFVDLVNIEIKIVIDDIACGSNKNRTGDDPDQLSKIIYAIQGKINTVVKKQLGQYNKYKIRPADQT